MDLQDRLKQLEANRDWQGALELLEECVANAEGAEAKSGYHLQLGRLLHTRFLQGVKALKHFQDAFKLNPALTEALVEARAIYWELGKLNMVQKLLELELKGAPANSAWLLSALGDVYADLGDMERASGAYAQALRDGAASAELGISDKLEDAQAGEAEWQARVTTLVSLAQSGTARERVQLLLRAARLVKRFLPSELDGILAQAYIADPTDREAAALFEGALVEGQRTEEILETQRAILKKISEPVERARIAFSFGARWALWHQNHDLAAEFIEQSLRDNPANDPAFAYLREMYGTEGGDWNRVVQLADSLADRLGKTQDAAVLLASAALLKWHALEDVAGARTYFARLEAIFPEHPAVQAYRAEFGAMGSADADEAPESDAVAASGPTLSLSERPPQSTDESSLDAPDSASAAASDTRESQAAPAAAPAVAQAATTGDPARIAELRAKLAEQEAAKRQHEYVKTLLLLGDEVPDPSEKAQLFAQAGELYATKFMNQAEATKAYEKVLELEPGHKSAIEYLRQTYEKRRDWEKLISLKRGEAEALSGAARVRAFKEIAELATEKVKKPELCIDLWAVVVDNDPSDSDALKALVQLYERSREYDKLADVLLRLVQYTDDNAQKIQLLTKLGQVAGDRLKDDEKAAEAYRMLLAIDPEDRRAQEQLKKRYLALGRWDDLEIFYAESGKWDEFIRVLETSEAKAETPEQRIKMLMKIAELWMTQKGKPDRSAKAYEKVLSIDENNLEAAEHLIPIYADASNARGLASAIEVKLRHAADPGLRLELLREVAALYEGRVGDKPKAFERYLAAFELASGDDRAQGDLERAALATGSFDAVTAAYNSAIGEALQSGDGVTATGLRLRLGRVFVDELKDVDKALEQYHAVYEEEPENAIALAALERLYQHTERWKELLDVYVKRADLAADSAERRPILLQIAELYEHRLSKPKKAIEAYITLLEDDAMDREALSALDRLYHETESWSSFVEILQRRIELDASTEQLIDLKYRLAQAQELHLNDKPAALDNYREILFLNPDHDGAREALEKLLTHKTLQGEAARILESIYEARQEWANLVRTLEILVSASKESERRVELLRKIASVTAAQLRDLPSAFDAQARALSEAPALDDCRYELEALAQQADAWDRVVALYSKIAGETSEPALARAYWLRLAAIQQQLSEIDAAAQSYDELLKLDPSDDEALRLMDALYRGAGRFTDLVSVFRRRIELTDDNSEREQLYGELAQVYDEKLSNPGDAIAAYREILGLEPTSQIALLALDALFTRQAMWPDLAENLETRLTLAENDAQQLELMLRLAALREREMGQVEAAIEGYRQVLERDSTNARALGALELLGQTEEHELHIAEILEPLYRQQGDYAKLIGVHEVQVRRSNDLTHRVELLHQIAALYEDAAADAVLAFDTLARALAEDPANDATKEGLGRLARMTSRFDDLARVFEGLAKSQKDAELGSQLYMAAAQTVENDVGDVERAIDLYRKVLNIDPTNLSAARALESLFQSTERYADMSLVLQRKAEMLENIEERKAALYQAATLEEEVLGRQENAIAVYQNVLTHDVEDIRSIDALINLYLRLERWEQLLDVQGKKVDLVVDADEKKVIYYQMGSVFERELDDVPRAIDTYQRVLELDPDDLTALGRLDVLYQAAQNWGDLLSILMHEAELTADPAEAISYQYRIAELYEQRLEDVPRSIELYRDILNIQADHEPTLRALEGIKAGRVEPLAAALVLEPVYDAMGEYEKLISALEVQVRFSEDAFAKVELLHRIARLCEESLDNHQRAFEVYARAVQTDSHNEESLAALERLAMMNNRWPQVTEIYDGELEKLTDHPERFVELALRVAQVYEVQLDNVTSAIERYRRVLQVDAENRGALRALDRLYLQTENYSDLIAILLRESEIGESPDEILEFKYRTGKIAQSKLNDLDGAIAAYSEVLAAAPEHEMTRQALEGLFESGIRQPQIGEILEPLYQAAGEYERLADVHEAQLTHIREPAARLAMFYRIADDSEERLLDAERAFAVYGRALREHPLDERVNTEIERLATEIQGGWERLANEYANTMESAAPAVQGALGKRLARVFEQELQDVGKAEESYRYVLTVVPGDADALSELDRIYTLLEQWPELAGILEQRAEVTSDGHDKVELYSRLGQVYEMQLGQVESATVSYRKIFDQLEPSNEGAITALARIYEAQQAWRSLNEVYERQLKNAHGDVEEADIRAKLAHLAFTRLGKIEEAIEGWKRVLDLRGEDIEALDSLADLYEKEERWAELSDVLERQFDIAVSEEERVNALTRRARLFTHPLGRDDEALETWQRVLDIDFSDVGALRAIADIWRRRQNPSELVAALHTMVDRVASAIEGSEVIAIYRELGRTYSDVLQQPFDAADAWSKLLEVSPTDFEAMDELEKIYRADARFEDVVRVKMQRSEALEEPEQKIRELLEVTGIWKEQIENYDQATDAFERILAIDPNHEKAFDELEVLHAAAGRWETLVEMFLNRLEGLTEPRERSQLLRKIARVFDQELSDKDQAFEALVNAFSEDFADDETVEYLERLAQAGEKWGVLLETANSWLAEQTEPKKRIKLCLRLGKWYGEDLGHPEWAQPYYQQVMQLDPNNVQVLRQMASIYRMGAHWTKMGETLTRALDVAVANEDRKLILCDLGELLEKHMDQLDAGVSYYRRALEIDPHYLPAIDALERIYGSKEDYPELVKVLSRRVEAQAGTPGIAATKLRLGDLFEKRINDPERAVKEYRDVLEADAGNINALRGLERVYGQLQKWSDLVEVLEKQLDVVESERERIEVFLKIATIQEEQFLKADIAAQRLEQALDINPSEVRAYKALERCYRRLKQWPELVRTYDRHISECASQDEKVELYRLVAETYANEIQDADQAISAYQNLIDLEDSNVAALEALSRLYEKQGDTQQSIEAMTRVADLTVDGKQRVEMYYRIGRTLEEKLSDRLQAREKFETALDLDPSHLATLAALRNIAIEEGDYDAAARYLEQEQGHTESARTRARLLVELGRIRQERLEEHDLAIKAYQLAIQQDEDCEEAALPLVQEYVQTERFAEAEPLAEMLVRKAKSRDRQEQHSLNFTLGKVHAALGNDEKALKAYQAANALDVTNQETVKGIAEVSYRLKDWPSALSNYQKVLTALGEDEVDERTDVYYRLGAIKREQGQVKQAVNNFEKALALNSEHRPTLEALVDTYEKAGEWKEVAAYKRQILDGVFEEEQRFALLMEIGDVWAEKQNEPKKAIEAYEEARSIRPVDHILLHKLLQLYQGTSDWQNMVDTIQAIADLETAPEKKARYFYTMAQIYRDKIEDLDRAVELFNEALDLNLELLESFERINKILTQQKNWKQLERQYRKMLHRLSGKGKIDLEFTLWHQLGLIYRDRIKEATPAIEAFRMASNLKPVEITERQILSELYELEERFDDAVGEQHLILETDPLSVEPYRNLYRLYLHKRAYDEAWCVAAAINFMLPKDKVTQEEQRFFDDYRPKGMLQVKGRLTNEVWFKDLFHPDLNLYISKIFEMIYPAALAAKIVQLKAQNKLPVLNKKFKQEPATSTITFAKTFGWAAQVLGVQVPELYVRNDVPGSVVAVPNVPLASVAGQTVLSGFQPQELTFICGKHLASYRGELYIHNLFPTQAELTIMLFAGVVLAAPNTPMPGDMAQQIRMTAQEIARYLQPIQLEGLRTVVKRFIEEGAKANIKKWNHAAELSASRAGFLLCGDLEIAKKIINAEPVLPGSPTPKEKMKDLLMFSVSDHYSALRKALGVNIAVGQ